MTTAPFAGALAQPLLREQSAPQTALKTVALAESDLDVSPRRVGVEFEFCNLSVDEAASSVSSIFGGSITQDDRHTALVETPDFGSFTVALDARFFAAKASDAPGFAQVRELAGDMASLVVPVEVTCPPVPAHQLDWIDALADALRENGAKGTSRSLAYAFGLHLNIEEPRATADDIVRTLQAYILLEDWLRDEIGVDLTRSAFAFEASFDQAYQERVLSADYAPSASELIDDYVAHNPSRNRGLDLLPILAFIDEDRVTQATPDEKIGLRQAYHYRLPNSEIDDPNWRVEREWRRWLVVEKLAARRHQLAQAAEQRLQLLRAPMYGGGGRRDIRAASISLGRNLRGGAS